LFELFDHSKPEIKSDQLGQKFVDEFQHDLPFSSKQTGEVGLADNTSSKIGQILLRESGFTWC
jgi:hypothetical protein